VAGRTLMRALLLVATLAIVCQAVELRDVTPSDAVIQSLDTTEVDPAEGPLCASAGKRSEIACAGLKGAAHGSCKDRVQKTFCKLKQTARVLGASAGSTPASACHEMDAAWEAACADGAGPLSVSEGCDVVRANICTCTIDRVVVGQEALGDACTQHGGNICTSCETGYRLDGNVCVVQGENVCACDYGQAVPNADCTINGSPNCTSCEDGYGLANIADNAKTCSNTACNCANGTVTTGAACLGNGLNHCSSCFEGFTLDGATSACIAVTHTEFYEVNIGGLHKTVALGSGEAALPGNCLPENHLFVSVASASTTATCKITLNNELLSFMVNGTAHGWVDVTAEVTEGSLGAGVTCDKFFTGEEARAETGWIIGAGEGSPSGTFASSYGQDSGGENDGAQASSYDFCNGEGGIDGSQTVTMFHDCPEVESPTRDTLR